MEKHFVNEIIEGIWKDRYCKNNESYEENLNRVATFVSSAENLEDRKHWLNEFLNVMQEGLFFPAGRTMSNSGIGEKLTLNNCFVAPIVPNSMEGIFNSVKLGAVTHKAGGGIGYNFSNLSPRGMKTHNDAIASGPVSFMDVFNAQTATVQQGSRRGANMGMLSVYHPDIYEFIKAKSTDSNRLNHFNVSVLVDDAFMEAVENDEDIKLHYPIYDKYGNKIPESEWEDEFTKVVKATDVWDTIMKLAYDNGEPGIFFEDTLKENNPAFYIENIVCSNPCSEYLAGTIKLQGVNPNEYGGACNLGSLFLHNFVKNPFTKQAYLDFSKLEQTVKTAVRMLDDIIEVNTFPSPIYENYQKNMRTIGLGFTGVGDMLAMLGYRYDSEVARNFMDSLLKRIVNYAYKCSIELAKTRGAFPFCDNYLHANSKYALKEINSELRKEIELYGIRNAKIFAVAPCGTISLAYGNNCSSGIEPIFSLSYSRKIKIGGQEESNAKIVEMMDYAYWLYNHMVERGEQVDYQPEEIFVTSLNIDVKDHVEMLGIVAKHIDMSTSKTINVPTDYPYDKVKDIYKDCWELGVKGCTIFRPNPIRPGVLFSSDSNNNSTDKVTTSKETLNVPKWKKIAPDTVYYKRKIRIGCGKLNLFIGWSDSEKTVQELWVKRTGQGGCEMNIQASVIAMSGMLRLGGNIFNIEKAFEGLGACNSFVSARGKGRQLSKGSSCATAILNEIKAFLAEKNNEKKNMTNYTDESVETKLEEKNTLNQCKDKNDCINDDNKKEIDARMVCPECGETLRLEGNCFFCAACGYTKCE